VQAVRRLLVQEREREQHRLALVLVLELELEQAVHRLLVLEREQHRLALVLALQLQLARTLLEQVPCRLALVRCTLPLVLVLELELQLALRPPPASHSRCYRCRSCSGTSRCCDGGDDAGDDGRCSRSHDCGDVYGCGVFCHRKIESTEHWSEADQEGVASKAFDSLVEGEDGIR